MRRTVQDEKNPPGASRGGFLHWRRRGERDAVLVGAGYFMEAAEAADAAEAAADAEAFFCFFGADAAIDADAEADAGADAAMEAEADAEAAGAAANAEAANREAVRAAMSLNMAVSLSEDATLIDSDESASSTPRDKAELTGQRANRATIFAAPHQDGVANTVLGAQIVRRDFHPFARHQWVAGQ
jgi:hypothetical protein